MKKEARKGAKVKNHIYYHDSEEKQMKIGNLVILNNKGNKYAIIDIQKRIRDVYIKGNNEAANAAYRTITGADVKESWRVVKPWIREWEGEG